MALRENGFIAWCQGPCLAMGDLLGPVIRVGLCLTGYFALYIEAQARVAKRVTQRQ